MKPATLILLLVAASQVGGSQVLGPDPTVELAVTRSGEGSVAAIATPSPEILLRVMTGEVADGARLTCTIPREGVFQCSQDVLLEYAGCFSPVPVVQPPIVRTKARR